MDNTVILFKFATRSRPEKFLQGLDNIYNFLDDKENYHILISADRDDETMLDKTLLTEYKKRLEYMNMTLVFGESKTKIEAINADMDKAPKWDILVNYSDDMEFFKQGFDNHIRDCFKKFYPDLDGNLHFNDGYVKEKISTMSIMGYPYYKRFDYIYHPSYKSLFCDNEYTIIANRLNKIVYIHEQIFKHNHFVNIGSKPDKLYEKNEALYKQDEDTFTVRVRMGFPK